MSRAAEDIRPEQLVPGARILVTGADEPIYGTVVRMDLPRVGWFAYDRPTGGPSEHTALFHLLNVAAVVDLWELATPVPGYCCDSAWLSRTRPVTVHTAGCSWRCRRPTPVPVDLHRPGIIPCARTAGHSTPCHHDLDNPKDGS